MNPTSKATSLDIAVKRFEKAIEHYKEAIDKIEAADKAKNLSDDRILELIHARNWAEEAKQEAIKVAKKNKQLKDNKLNQTIEELNKLKYSFNNEKTDLIDLIIKTVRLLELKKSQEKDWWWLLEPITPLPWSDRFDWLWRFLSILFLTASVSILIDSSTRLLSPGPDILGIFAVTLPSMITLITSGGALTKPGQEVIQRFLISIGVNKSWWDEVVCALLFFLLVLMVLFWFSLPHLATIYTKIGDYAYICQEKDNANSNKNCKLATAEKSYQRAIKLDPDEPKNYYKLGKIQEELENDTEAITNYKIAVKGVVIEAYNSLVRFYIKGKDKDYLQAERWLEQCLKLAKGKEHKLCSADIELILSYLRDKKYDDAAHWLSQMTEYWNVESDINDSKAKSFGLTKKQYRKKQYDILTYFGWALMKQESYKDAEFQLQKAIKKETEEPLAHCLLAEVREKLNNKKGAKKEWQECIRWGDEYDRYVGRHIRLAKKRAAKNSVE